MQSKQQSLFLFQVNQSSWKNVYFIFYEKVSVHISKLQWMEQFRHLICQHAINCIPCAATSKAQGQNVVQKEVLIWRIKTALAVQKQIMRNNQWCCTTSVVQAWQKKGKSNSIWAGAFLVRKKMTLYNILMKSKVGTMAQVWFCVLKKDYWAMEQMQRVVWFWPTDW